MATRHVQCRVQYSHIKTEQGAPPDFRIHLFHTPKQAVTTWRL